MFKVLPQLGLLALLAIVVNASSAPFKSQEYIYADLKTATYDQHLFTPAECLDALSESTFTTLGHPLFPQYGVRVKKSKFCDGTVNSYTGYIDINARHLFFYFFESRNDPAKDDVILWMNGGPGCSSSLGLFMELGPCRISNSSGPTFHPESWNSNASVFFLDQPVHVGFSYAQYGETVDTTEEAAKDVAAFLSVFFENFRQFRGRALHIAGESYAGRYIPLFAAKVYDQNAKLIQAGATPINLTSVLIGNGLTDPYTMASSYFDMLCTPVSIPPIMDIATCVRMKKALPRCQKWMKAACVDHFDAMDCEAANNFCQNELGGPMFASGKNPYDLSADCDGGMETLCYPVIKQISDYLNKPDVRAFLGVDPAVANFSACSDAVGTAFANHLDTLQSSFDYVAALLERDVKVLIYVGSNDWICNWVGNERWTLALEWTGQEEFRKQSLREWKVNGKVAGMTRSVKGLTFATVHGAGHMVPYDKPTESLQLMQRWLAREDL